MIASRFGGRTQKKQKKKTHILTLVCKRYGLTSITVSECDKAWTGRRICALPPGSRSHVIVRCREPRFKVSYSHRDVCRGGKNDRQIFKPKLVLAFCVPYPGKASSHPAAQAVISCWFSPAAQAGSAVAQVNQRVFFFYYYYYFVKRFRFYGSKSGQSGTTRQEEVEDFGESEA